MDPKPLHVIHHISFSVALSAGSGLDSGRTVSAEVLMDSLGGTEEVHEDER